MERAIDPRFSIVKYTDPLKVGEKDGTLMPEKDRIPSEVKHEWAKGDVNAELFQQLQDILNCILPPREWRENGELWRQQVSPQPSNRSDVINLRKVLELNLKLRHARDKGIDPVRRDLFNQLYDEMIRQETIVCPERGVLMLRLRDEIKMTLAAYRSLFESGKAYGDAKAADCEVLSKMEATNAALRVEKEEIEKEIEVMEEAVASKTAAYNDLLKAVEKTHAGDIIFAHQVTTQLKTLLENIQGMKMEDAK